MEGGSGTGFFWLSPSSTRSQTAGMFIRGQEEHPKGLPITGVLGAHLGHTRKENIRELSPMRPVSPLVTCSLHPFYTLILHACLVSELCRRWILVGRLAVKLGGSELSLPQVVSLPATARPVRPTVEPRGWRADASEGMG